MYDVCLCNKMNRTQLLRLPEIWQVLFYNNSFIISNFFPDFRISPLWPIAKILRLTYRAAPKQDYRGIDTAQC